MRTRSLVTATLAAATIVATAPTTIAGPRGTVSAPVNNVVFEVASRGSGKSDYLWCGAADFALRTQSAGWRDHIYVVRGRGKGQVTNRGVAAQFTLDPGAAGVEPIPDGQSFNTLAVGYSMSVQRANSYCAVPPDLFL